jgi:hypothetical protein
MKKIINGSRYDTSTAREIGYTIHGTRRDINFVCETLFRTKAGKFFLYGEGGPNTKYAEQTGTNSWSSGEKIMPMTYEEAREWAEKHLDGDQVEAAFGVVEEAEGRELISFTLPPSTVAKLRRESEQTGKAMSAIVAELIEKL